MRHIDDSTKELATLANNVSMIYKDMGQLDKALPFMEKAVAIMEFKFPNGHPRLDKMRNNLARLLKEIEDKIRKEDEKKRR